MKKTRIAKMLTAATLSAAMVMSMGGMTAFAATPVTFDKELNIGANDSVPTATFGFTIIGGEKVAATSNNMGIESGIEGAKIEPVTIDSESIRSGNTVEETVTVDFSKVNFTKPGIYRYVITENSFTKENVGDVYEDIGYAEGETGTRYLDVVVVNDGKGGYEISKYQLLKDKVNIGTDGNYINASTVKSGEFTNKYTTNTLTLTKHVTGDMGDKGAYFPFTVKFTGPKNTKFKVTVNDGAEFKNVTEIDLGEDGVAEYKNEEVKLKNDGTITISGVPSCVEYTITEIDQALAGYKTTNMINSNTTDWDDVVVSKDDINLTTGIKKVGTDATDNNTVAVDFVNYRTTTDVPMTGIILNFAPYALLVAFAGVFAVLFLRKRREEF